MSDIDNVITLASHADLMNDKKEVIHNARVEYFDIIDKVRRIHQLLKRGEATQDHGVHGNLDCIIDHLTDIPSVL